MRANVSDDLLPFTKLVLVVSATVQLVFGAAGFFFIGLWNSFFWTQPLPPWPEVPSHFSAISYFATALAARVYFAFSFPYIAMGLLVALYTAATTGIPLMMWLYILLGFIYLPVVAYVWLNQSRRS
jgi:hypothetical protein